MRTAHILLLCILGAALLSTAVCQSPNQPDQCCFQYYPRRIKKDLIASYTMTDRRCAKTAAILVTVQNRTICVDPSLSWVEGIMKGLDERFF